MFPEEGSSGRSGRERKVGLKQVSSGWNAAVSMIRGNGEFWLRRMLWACRRRNSSRSSRLKARHANSGQATLLERSRLQSRARLARVPAFVKPGLAPLPKATTALPTSVLRRPPLQGRKRGALTTVNPVGPVRIDTRCSKDEVSVGHAARITTVVIPHAKRFARALPRLMRRTGITNTMD